MTVYSRKSSAAAAVVVITAVQGSTDRVKNTQCVQHSSSTNVGKETLTLKAGFRLGLDARNTNVSWSLQGWWCGSKRREKRRIAMMTTR